MDIIKKNYLSPFARVNYLNDLLWIGSTEMVTTKTSGLLFESFLKTLMISSSSVLICEK